MIYFRILTIALLFHTGLNAQPKKGLPAPDIILPNAMDSMLQLSSLKGRVVLVDFWASWCGPCRNNNPALVKLYEQYAHRGFEILGVSIDTKSADWKRAIDKDGLRWLQVIDSKGWNAQSTLDYGVEGIPASFLIDRKGILRGINLHGRELEAAIKRWL